MAKVSVNTYNAIVPQKESNVNVWFLQFPNTP